MFCTTRNIPKQRLPKVYYVVVIITCVQVKISTVVFAAIELGQRHQNTSLRGRGLLPYSGPLKKITRVVEKKNIYIFFLAVNASTPMSHRPHDASHRPLSTCAPLCGWRATFRSISRAAFSEWEGVCSTSKIFGRRTQHLQ